MENVISQKTISKRITTTFTIKLSRRVTILTLFLFLNVVQSMSIIFKEILNGFPDRIHLFLIDFVSFRILIFLELSDRNT